MRPTLIRLLDKALVAQMVVLAALARRYRRQPPSAGRQRALAIKLVGMGDAVLMLSALAALRRAGFHLTVLTTRRCAQVFTAPGIADEVIVARGFAAWRPIWQAARHADAIFDFEQHVYWSAAVALLAPRARRHGFRTRSRRRNLAYHVLVDPGATPRPMKKIFDDLVRPCGADPQPECLPLPLEASMAEFTARWLAFHNLHPERFLVVAPGSGATVGFRRLPAATWSDALDLAEPSLGIVLCGTQLERELLVEVSAGCKRKPVVELGLNLRQLASLMRQSAAVVATDSGPMHLAAAMGVPVVGVFGPDTPARYAPHNGLSRSLWLGLPCSPCNNCWIYREARCTNPERYACVRTIPASELAAAIQAVLSGARGRGASG